MKDTFYFSHDYNVRSDAKIKKLIRATGIAGYGIFWAIIEDLYNNANALQTDYEGIAYDLRTDSDTVKSVINDFDLFVIDNGYFGSLSVERRLSERNDKSEKARQSAFKRWEKSEPDANAMRTHSEGNAIKESKEKEIKGKEKDEKLELIFPFSSEKFKKLWGYWKEYKLKEHKFKYKTILSEQAALKSVGELAGQNEETALKIIEQSIANGWQGFFDLKDTKNGSKQIINGQNTMQDIIAERDRKRKEAAANG